MSFLIENSAGDILGDGKSESAAIERAVEMLRDDPELAELLVMEWRGVATVTHGPDADWQSQVVVLKPGEKVEPPDDSWKMPSYMRDDLFDGTGGYDLSDPKHPGWHSVHADYYDGREK